MLSLKAPHPVAWLFLLLCLAPAAILLVNDLARAPWFVWRQSLYLIALWLVFIMARQPSSDWFNAPRWCALFTVIAHLYVIYALIEAFHLRFSIPLPDLFSFWSDKETSFSGPLRQYNQQSLFLVFTITLLWRQIGQRQNKWAWEVATQLPICGLILTTSKSGLLLLILATMLILVTSSHRKQALYTLLRTIVGGTLLSWWVLHGLPEHFSSNTAIIRAERALADPDPSLRIFLWKVCYHLWIQHPLLGIGWGNLPAWFFDGCSTVISHQPEWGSVTSELTGGTRFAHNIILQFLVEGGVFGGGALLLLFTALARKAYQWWIYRPTVGHGAITGWLCAVIILGNGMVSVAALEPFFSVLLALSLAACFSSTSDPPASHPSMHPPIIQTAVFIPAILMAYFWFHVTFNGYRVEQAMHCDFYSPCFQQAIKHNIDDPWLHNSTRRRLFQKMLGTGVSNRTWMQSEGLALSIWREYQFAGAAEIIIAVYHAKNEPTKAMPWVRELVSIFPHDPHFRQMLEHVQHTHGQEKGLQLRGLW